MFCTNVLFKPGKITTTLDISAGSSGKGKLNAWICENANNWQFACNAFMSNAAHWIELDDGSRIMYQSLNSCAYLKNKFEKIYICGGAVLELEPLLKEIEENGVNPSNLGINPLVAIVQDIDRDYERGMCDFDGIYKSFEPSENMKIGSTLHGVGAARARRILRKKNVLLAKDVDILKPFLCDTREEIINRLDSGQSGLLEIAQGFQLGYLETKFYPKTTSRNCTVAAGLDDCGIPPYYAGNVVLNARTYPIRVNSDKFVHVKTNEILTYNDMLKFDKSEVKVISGDSGAGYPDQSEIQWDQINNEVGKDVTELSSLTKLPRRVFNFSQQNLIEAIKYNKTNEQMFLSINFANYVDQNIENMRTRVTNGIGHISRKLGQWVENNNIYKICDNFGVEMLCWGTGPKNNDVIVEL